MNPDGTLTTRERRQLWPEHPNTQDVERGLPPEPHPKAADIERMLAPYSAADVAFSAAAPTEMLDEDYSEQNAEAPEA